MQRIKRTADSADPFIEYDRLGRDCRAGFGRMIGIIQPDTDEFTNPADAGANARIARHLWQRSGIQSAQAVKRRRQYPLSLRRESAIGRRHPGVPDALRPADRNVIVSSIASLPASEIKALETRARRRAYPLVQLDENCPALKNDRAVHFCFLPTCIYSKTPNGVGNLLTGGGPEQDVPGATGFFSVHAEPSRPAG